MKRDFIGDLLAAAKTYQPQIRRGMYDILVANIVH